MTSDLLILNVPTSPANCLLNYWKLLTSNMKLMPIDKYEYIKLNVHGVPLE